MSESKGKPCVTPPAASYPPPKGQWSTGIYDCWDDLSNCFITCCFPYITMGRIAEIVDKGSICWEANVKKWKQEGLTRPPVVAPGMDR